MTNIPLSNRVNSIKPSATIAVSTLARELRAAGRDVIGLGAGEPDFATPENIQQAAIEAMRNGMTKYTPADGTPELKNAVVDKFERDNQLTYTSANIVVSNGAKQSIINLLTALLNENDEVVIVAPYWVSYTDMTVLSGGKPVVVNTTNRTGFQVTARTIARGYYLAHQASHAQQPQQPDRHSIHTSGSGGTRRGSVRKSSCLCRH